MKNIKEILYSYLFYTICAFSISLSIKANVGISSFNAMNMALSGASAVKVGTITSILNIIFLFSYMYLSNFKEKSKYMLQLISVLLFGFLINFFTYVVLKDFFIANYTLRILLIVVGTILSGLSVGMIINYGKITFPIESFCLVFADKTTISFMKTRYSIDIISVVISTTISLTFGLPLFVREGTIISLILFSASINFMKNTYTQTKGANIAA